MSWTIHLQTIWTNYLLLGSGFFTWVCNWTSLHTPFDMCYILKTRSLFHTFIFSCIYEFLTLVSDDKEIKFLCSATSISTSITCSVTSTLCPVTSYINRFKYSLDSGHIVWMVVTINGYFYSKQLKIRIFDIF